MNELIAEMAVRGIHPAEIGGILGLSTWAVRSRLKRIHRRAYRYALVQRKPPLFLIRMGVPWKALPRVTHPGRAG